MYVQLYIIHIHDIILCLLTYIQKEEFCRSVDISPYSFFKDDDVFVLWQWSWIDNHPSISPSPIPHSNSCTPDLNLDTQASSDLDDEISAIIRNDDGIPAITHTVVFKCIGATKNLSTKTS